MSFDPEQFDFDHCEDEPIHIPESIQGHGYLLAVEPETGEIRIHSENAIGLLKQTEDKNGLTGMCLFDAIDENKSSVEFLKASYHKASTYKLRLPLPMAFKADHLKNHNFVDYEAVVFSSGGLMVLELESESPSSLHAQAKQLAKIHASNVAHTFPSLASVEVLAHEIARIIKELTAFERVVVYRFNKDGSGTVIGEAKEDDIESYLNFYYPASDIPQQARDLYKVNWIRMNPDVNAEPLSLVPATADAGRPPLDLTQSLLRAMSPIHVQYVRNQGLRASMSISLVNNGQLWGLISCHHRRKHYIPQSLRLECETLGHIFAWQIYAKQAQIKQRRNAIVRNTTDRLIDGLSRHDNIVDLFKEYETQVLELMDAQGFAFYAGSEAFTIGQTPDEASIWRIAELALAQGSKRSFASHQLRELKGDVQSLQGVRGALVTPLLARKRYFTAWFRPECKRSITWAGDPTEKSVISDKKARLTPRSSFALHVQSIENESKAWTDQDIGIAEQFNRLFFRQALSTTIEMQERILALREQDQTKNEFLATLAHELRNPLSPISNAVSVLKIAQSPEQQRSAYDIIERQLKHVVTLVDDLLDVSRITRGKIRLEPRDLDLVEVVRNGMETNAPLIQDKEQSLSFDVDEGARGATVHGDYTRLTQLYGNIIHNASKYTDRGGHIWVRISVEADKAVVEIADSGIGIPASHIDRIFEMFSQVDASSTQTRGGLGIGLTLVKSLVHLHHGEISVSSPGLGQGSTFRVSLPLAKTEKGKSSTLDLPAADENNLPSSAKKVLVVDDNTDLTAMLEMLLGLMGHKVEVRNSSSEALRDFAAIAPDVALLDLGLPEIDGYELCRRLKKEHPDIGTLFVAQTGWGSKEHLEKSKQAGFDHHLVKPVAAESLAELLAAEPGSK